MSKTVEIKLKILSEKKTVVRIKTVHTTNARRASIIYNNLQFLFTPSASRFQNRTQMLKRRINRHRLRKAVYYELSIRRYLL